MDTVSFDDFLKFKICVGTILKAEENIKLKKPAIILTIDFGMEIGIKKSSAQIKENYNCENLIDKQIIAVTNFPPKQIGNIISEVLVLALPNDLDQPILLSPDYTIINGKRLY